MEMFQTLYHEYGIWAMLLLIFLEYACFPISSEIVLPLSGAIAAAEHYPFLLIVPLSVLAGLGGTFLCYGFGYFGGDALLNYIVCRFPSFASGIKRSQKSFVKHGAIATCLLRIVPLCRTYIAFVAGAFRMSPSVYLSSSLLGITLWNSLLMGAGYALGSHWEHVQKWLGHYRNLLLPLTLGLLLLILIIKLRRSLSVRKKRDCEASSQSPK